MKKKENSIHAGKIRAQQAKFRYITTWSILFLLPVCIIVQPCSAQPPADEIENFFHSAFEDGHFHGAALVARGNDVIYRGAFGLADFEHELSNRPEMPFPVRSITKSFTAILVLQLVEEGKLRLDGTLHEYLPEYPSSAADRITIHQMMTHTSGLPEFMLSMPGWMEYDPPDISADSALAFVAGLPLEYDPGNGYAYTNTCYVLLGQIIERITGRQYAEILEERILAPLEMHDTQWIAVLQSVPGVARQHLPGRQDEAPQFSAYIGASGIVSTLDDMLRFGLGLNSNQLLDSESWSLAFTPHALPENEVRFHPATQVPFGYGFALPGSAAPGGNPDRIALHAGMGYGGSAMFIRFLDEDWTVVFWSNRGGPPMIPGLMPFLMETIATATGTAD
jgi:CubicO group peptidase (beta-lactamase class C family)